MNFTKYKKWNNKIEVRLRKPLPYDFMMAFKFVVIIFILSTMFDLTMTYVHFHLTPEHFFQYEFSYIIERSFAGDKIYYAISVFCFVFPIWVCYHTPIKFKKKYGYFPYVSSYFLKLLFAGSFLHIYGGFTNFFYLISLRMLQI